jgi:hypothetical protein
VLVQALNIPVVPRTMNPRLDMDAINYDALGKCTSVRRWWQNLVCRPSKLGRVIGGKKMRQDSELEGDRRALGDIPAG